MKVEKIVYFEVTENKADNFIELPALRGDKKLGYPTQKHEDLLERIIKASSNEGDLLIFTLLLSIFATPIV